MRPIRFLPVRLVRPSASAIGLWRLLAALPLMALLSTWQSIGWSQDAYPPGLPLDPPGQVARLDVVQGPLSFAPADAAESSNAWTPADINRPLTRGDRLWTGPQARAELHAGSTAVRMGEQTSLDFLALDDSVVQLRLPAGSLQLRVRALFEGQRLEVNTPNLAFVIAQPGDYRLDVNPAADTTRVLARTGSGVIYGDGVSVALGSAQQASFSGARLMPAATGGAPLDGFDAWTAERDRREDESVSARYVPRETIGYQQLDNYGDWQQDPAHGAVWLPRAMPVDWAPYSAGRWSWISPWGWTWIDDAPWGFAPFHYGRWTQIGPRWAWVPGRLAQRPVYAPALVGFVGGAAPGTGGAVQRGLGWFPLAPGEAFRPAYRASAQYVGRLNGGNGVQAGDGHRYQHQPAAVTALRQDDFARGRQFLGRADGRERSPLSPVSPLYLPAPLAAVQPHQPRTLAPQFAAPERQAAEADARVRREQQLLQERQRQQQSDQARLHDQQRRQGEAALLQQRALQEQGHRQQEMLRQQQQQQVHEQQRRHGEAVLLQQQHQQRVLREQARQQAPQQPAVILPGPPRPQAQGGPPPRLPEAAQRRGPWPDAGAHRHREP